MNLNSDISEVIMRQDLNLENKDMSRPVHSINRCLIAKLIPCPASAEQTELALFSLYPPKTQEIVTAQLNLNSNWE
jgi:hypothetical protein